MTVCRSRVDEVDAGAVEFGAEVLEFVQLALAGAPVEPVGPVRQGPSEVVEFGTLFPGDAGHLVGPAGVVDAHLEVRENVVIDVDGERLNPHGLDPKAARVAQRLGGATASASS